MNASVVAVMREAGKALNDTFHLNDAGIITDQSGPCAEGVAIVDVTGEFDFITSMEDLSKGQRIGNYSVDFKRKSSSTWEVLVPAVQPRTPAGALTDRPDGHDPRDQYIGHKRIDVPIVPTSGDKALPIAQVRLNCHRLIETVEAGGSVYVRSLSLHKKLVPWESTKSLKLDDSMS
jgi:hypothetical protein